MNTIDTFILDNQWHVQLGGSAMGPFAWHHIADLILDGIIDHQTLVRQSPADTWIIISNTSLSGLLLGPD